MFQVASYNLQACMHTHIHTHTHTHTHTYIHTHTHTYIHTHIHTHTHTYSGHRKTKVYLNRFNLTDNPMCPCNEGEQSGEHLIYVCRILEPQRSSMIQHITTRGGIWLPSNNELVTRYLNAFAQYVKSIDFSKL